MRYKQMVLRQLDVAIQIAKTLEVGLENKTISAEQAFEHSKILVRRLTDARAKVELENEG